MELIPATNRRQLAGQWLLVGGVYFAFGWLIAQLPFREGASILFWPAAGWALFSMVVFGGRIWPGIVLGQSLLVWYHQAPLLMLVGLLPGSALEAWTGARLILKRRGMRPEIRSVSDALWFLTVLSGVSLISATLSVGGKWLGGNIHTGPDFGYDWIRWAIGDALGMLVMYPFLINWVPHHGARRDNRPVTREYIVCTCVLLAISLLVYDPFAVAGASIKSVAFLPLPILMWIALRFGVRLASVAVLIVVACIFAGAALDDTGILNLSPGMRVMITAGFTCMITVAALLAAAAAAEQQEAQTVLLDREERVRSLLEDAADGIFLCDVRGRLLEVNRRACEMMGYTRGELLAMRVSDLITAESLQARPLELEKFPHAGTRLAERVIRTRDGRRIDVEVNARRLKDGRIQAIVRDISQRQKTDVALAESERLVRRILDTTPNIVYVFDLETQKNVYSNRKITDLLGYEREEIDRLGDRFMAELLHPEDLARLPELLLRWDTATDHDVLQTEYRMKSANGEWHWFQGTDAVFKRDNRKKVVQIIGNAQDITTQRAAQEQLRQENQFNELIIASAGEGICVCQEIANFPYIEFTVWNRQMTEITGYEIDEINQSGWYQSLYPDPDLRQRAIERMQRMRAGDNLQGEEWEICRKDRSCRQILITTRLLQLQDGPHVMAVMNDITHRKKAEADLTRTEDLYRRAIAAANAVPYMVDHVTGEFTFMGEGIEKLTGYPVAEMTRERWFQITELSVLQGEAAGMSMEDAIRQLRTGRIKVWQCDTRIITRNGTPRWVTDCAVEMQESDGTSSGSIGIFVDITQRKEAEDRLQSTEDLYRRAIAAANAVPYMEDHATGEFTFMGEGIEKLTGYSVAEMTRELWTSITESSIIQGEAAGMSIDEAIKMARSGRLDLWQCDTLIRTRHGTKRWLADCAVEIRGPGGKTTGSIGILVDITDRKQNEEEFRQMNEELENRVAARTEELNQRVMDVERLNTGMINLLEDLQSARQISDENAGKYQTANQQLKAINQELEAFSYSISHDLRAPLRHIHGFVRLLQKEAEAKLSDQGRHQMSIISESATRMSQLIDDLLEFSRTGRSVLKQTSVDLNTLVGIVTKEFETETSGRNIRWIVHPLPPVLGDPNLLRQVFTNLISNAVKYTSRKPGAVIEIGAESPGEHGLVGLFVRDNGAGFDMQYAGKLFGVFQRLHRQEEFEGTGIGLANVRRILHRHGGTIRAEAAPGRGATFRFTLPAVDSPLRQEPVDPV